MTIENIMLSRPEKLMLSKLNFLRNNTKNINSEFFNDLPISVLIAHCVECTSLEDVMYIASDLGVGDG